ncbi:hypothetical protein AQS8620_02540 [Aquimixticola soesokkakensis]|uniref:Uncharacterized protein n=1 Tax=Aquimixticola soesokkakensis TaxID=1519096 RepID=A0A1Y5T746_9RHOB|nr:hypothetical protein [Aquimixticola soesokkakensis]SLN57428.1 hypothetical protein AQS8620_02540 [Aquimixticola soesokkakensis]
MLDVLSQSALGQTTNSFRQPVEAAKLAIAAVSGAQGSGGAGTSARHGESGGQHNGSDLTGQRVAAKHTLRAGSATTNSTALTPLGQTPLGQTPRALTPRGGTVGLDGETATLSTMAKAIAPPERFDPDMLTGPTPAFQASILEVESDLRNVLARIESERAIQADSAAIATKDAAKATAEAQALDREASRLQASATAAQSATTTGLTTPTASGTTQPPRAQGETAPVDAPAPTSTAPAMPAQVPQASQQQAAPQDG